MRRADREITERYRIDGIIRRCRVCRLAMCDEGQPYIVPLNFGYDGSFLYFHAAHSGKKINILRKNDRVCFEFDLLHEICASDLACDWGARYESVIGTGTAEFLETSAAKVQALEWIMRQYGDRAWHFTEQMTDQNVVLRVRIEEISGKARL